MGEESIVIYDGECNLCDSSVKFILRHESNNELRFTHLASPEGERIMREFNIDPSIDAVLFVNNGKIFIKSKAVFEISKYLKYPFKLVKYFSWVPLFISDTIYDFIAKRRYKWFGKDDCLILDEKIKVRFI